MTTIKFVEESQASPEIKAVYDEVKQRFGFDFVPNFWKAEAAFGPEVLRRRWDQFQKAESKWGKEVVHVIGLATATVQNSPYTINFHTGALRQIGYDDQKIRELVDEITAHMAVNAATNAFQMDIDQTPEMMAKKAA